MSYMYNGQPMQGFPGQTYSGSQQNPPQPFAMPGQMPGQPIPFAAPMQGFPGQTYSGSQQNPPQPFAMGPMTPPLPQGGSEVSSTWIDQCYGAKEEGYYMSLDDAMKKAEFLREFMADGTRNYLPELAAELISDINTRKFIEQRNMSPTEARAVAIYTYDFGPENMERNPYFVVNRFLYQKDGANVDKYLSFVVHLLRGLRKLEVSSAPVLYRAVKDGFHFDEGSVGREFTWDSFTSTTGDGSVVAKFAAGGASPTIFEIRGPFRGYSVRALSFHPDEDEVIIEPGARLRVVSVAAEPGVPNGRRVCVQVVPTPAVLAGAVAFFAEEEKRREYRITPADVQGFVPAALRRANNMWTLDINRLYGCSGIDDVVPLFADMAWYPEVFMNLLQTADVGKLNMLAAAFTRMFMPTLSEIKDGVARDRVYGIFQYSENYPQCTNTFGLPGVPCGVSTKILEPPQSPSFARRFAQTLVSVGNTDTMEVIKQIHHVHSSTCIAGGYRSKIACLNMGNQVKPGGDWKIGGASLEELLFMRTTLSASLEEYLYPMRNLECIYTKDVTYIRNGKKEGYRFLAPNERFSFDVVTTCAFNLKKPVYVGTEIAGYDDIPFTPEIEQLTYQKIRAILSACASNGADVLILGALGCGAYSNPPDRIAALFKQAIKEFTGVFSYVYFSIFNTETYSTFYNTLGYGCGAPENGYFKY